MAVVKRAQIKAPTLPKETVDVPSIGGEVVVYGLGLADKLRFATWEGPRFSQMCEVLACSVRDADGEQLWTADDWNAWGSNHLEEAVNLFGAVERLSGLSEAEAEKN